MTIPSIREEIRYLTSVIEERHALNALTVFSLNDRERRDYLRKQLRRQIYV